MKKLALSLFLSICFCTLSSAQKGTWEVVKTVNKDSLHFARNGMAAAVLNNKAYAAGGSGGGPAGPPPTTGQPVPRPPRPEQNHPVDLEIFILK